MVSLTNPEEMSITIKPDSAHPNGVYVVQWKTVSAIDGDPGAFVFTVNTGAVVTHTPVATTSTATGTRGTPIWVPVGVGIGTLRAGQGMRVRPGWCQSASSVGAMRKAVIQQSQEPIQHP